MQRGPRHAEGSDAVEANHADRLCWLRCALLAIYALTLLDCLCRSVVDLRLAGGLALVACYGPAMLRAWSQYLSMC
jgi:hypothetical protein